MNVLKTDGYQPNSFSEQDDDHAADGDQAIGNRTPEHDARPESQSRKNKNYRKKTIAVLEEEVAHCNIY